jgi:methylamine dehydrogenase accessory protein MauD
MTEVSILIGLLFAIDVVFLIALLALARQLGVLLVRLGPNTALPISSQGLDIGETLETYAGVNVLGNPYEISTATRKQKLLLFVRPRCPVCRTIKENLHTLARSYRSDTEVFVISGNPTAEDLDWAAELAKAEISYICDEALGLELGVTSAPYALVLDEENVLRAKGLVNDLEQVESLFVVEGFDFAGGSVR